MTIDVFVVYAGCLVTLRTVSRAKSLQTNHVVFSELVLNVFTGAFDMHSTIPSRSATPILHVGEETATTASSAAV